jgi:phospholipid-binding lipoprotein MlaA
MNLRPRRFAALAAVLLLGGCALGPAREDPFEPMNRVSYQVHEAIDGAIIKPVAQAYVDYAPKPLRQAITNFFGNIDDMFSVVNDLLQGKPDKAGNDLGRVITNTGFGILGLIDIASDAGIEKGNEDFGQTFGVWGIAQGPYLFVPLFGPTTIRDGTGWIVRGYSSPITYLPDVSTRNVLWALQYGDARASALQAENVLNQAALDRYTFIRRAYLQRRDYLVHDRHPPPAKDEP